MNRLKELREKQSSIDFTLNGLNNIIVDLKSLPSIIVQLQLLRLQTKNSDVELSNHIAEAIKSLQQIPIKTESSNPEFERDETLYDKVDIQPQDKKLKKKNKKNTKSKANIMGDGKSSSNLTSSSRRSSVYSSSSRRRSYLPSSRMSIVDSDDNSPSKSRNGSFDGSSERMNIINDNDEEDDEDDEDEDESENDVSEGNRNTRSGKKLSQKAINSANLIMNRNKGTKKNKSNVKQQKSSKRFKTAKSKTSLQGMNNSSSSSPLKNGNYESPSRVNSIYNYQNNNSNSGSNNGSRSNLNPYNFVQPGSNSYSNSNLKNYSNNGSNSNLNFYSNSNGNTNPYSNNYPYSNLNGMPQSSIKSTIVSNPVLNLIYKSPFILSRNGEYGGDEEENENGYGYGYEDDDLEREMDITTEEKARRMLKEYDEKDAVDVPVTNTLVNEDDEIEEIEKNNEEKAKRKFVKSIVEAEKERDKNDPNSLINQLHKQNVPIMKEEIDAYLGVKKIETPRSRTNREKKVVKKNTIEGSVPIEDGDKIIKVSPRASAAANRKRISSNQPVVTYTPIHNTKTKEIEKGKEAGRVVSDNKMNSKSDNDDVINPPNMLHENHIEPTLSEFLSVDYPAEVNDKQYDISNDNGVNSSSKINVKNESTSPDFDIENQTFEDNDSGIGKEFFNKINENSVDQSVKRESKDYNYKNELSHLHIDTSIGSLQQQYQSKQQNHSSSNDDIPINEYVDINPREDVLSPSNEEAGYDDGYDNEKEDENQIEANEENKSSSMLMKQELLRQSNKSKSPIVIPDKGELQLVSDGVEVTPSSLRSVSSGSRKRSYNSNSKSLSPQMQYYETYISVINNDEDSKAPPLVGQEERREELIRIAKDDKDNENTEDDYSIPIESLIQQHPYYQQQYQEQQHLYEDPNKLDEESEERISQQQLQSSSLPIEQQQQNEGEKQPYQQQYIYHSQPQSPPSQQQQKQSQNEQQYYQPPTEINEESPQHKSIIRIEKEEQDHILLSDDSIKDLTSIRDECLSSILEDKGKEILLLQQEIRNLNHKIDRLEKENKSSKKRNSNKDKVTENESVEIENESFDVESKLQFKSDDSNEEKDLTLLVSSFVRKKKNIKPVIERVKAVYYNYSFVIINRFHLKNHIVFPKLLQ